MTMASSVAKNDFFPPGLVSNLQEVLRKGKCRDEPDPISKPSSVPKSPAGSDEAAEPNSLPATNSARVNARHDSDSSKPVILVTNADGIESPGLTHLVQAIVRLSRYNVHVCAPQLDKSVSGHSLTLRETISVSVAEIDGATAYEVSGTRADCVSLALSGALFSWTEPLLVINGIDKDSTCGNHMIYSGIVAGAREMLTNGLPFISISLNWKKVQSQDIDDFKDAVTACMPVLETVFGDIENGVFPKNWSFQLEVPTSPLANKGFKLAKESTSTFNWLAVSSNSCDASAAGTARHLGAQKKNIGVVESVGAAGKSDSNGTIRYFRLEFLDKDQSERAEGLDFRELENGCESSVLLHFCSIFLPSSVSPESGDPESMCSRRKTRILRDTLSNSSATVLDSELVKTQSPDQMPDPELVDGQYTDQMAEALPQKTKKRRRMIRKKNLSDLPRDIINCIAELLPLVDAARMSLVLRDCRYAWTKVRNFILDSEFCDRLRHKYLGSTFRTEYMRIAYSGLFDQPRPMEKIVVEFPTLLTVSDFDTLVYWITFLAKNCGGLRELNLDNSKIFPEPGYRFHFNRHSVGRHLMHFVPHSIFLFPQLTHLTLTNCHFYSPFKVSARYSISNLTHLVLDRVSFVEPPRARLRLTSSDSRFIDAPRLVVLEMRDCYGVCRLRLSAPSLIKLYLFGNRMLDLSYFLNCRKLRDVWINTRYTELESLRLGKYGSVHLTKLLNSWPELTKLYLDWSSRKHLAADDNGVRPKRYPKQIQILEQPFEYTKKYYKDSFKQWGDY